MGSWVGRLGALALGVALLAVPARAEEPPPPEPVVYADVPGDHWADDAIRYVAEDRDWLRVPGDAFRPDLALTRQRLAIAAVRAFAPEEPIDPAITFADLDPAAASYPSVNVAVKLGWFSRTERFDPAAPATKATLNRVLVMALGLREQVLALQRLQTQDGVRLGLPPSGPYLALGNVLALNVNHRREERDLYPWDAVTRAHGAWALHRAATAGWRILEAQRFTEIELPAMNAARLRVVRFALKYLGYPYIYAGDWHRPIGAGYCCGSQPKGGFDCSGFQWWVMQRSSSSYPVARVRGYAGWRIGQRRASLIAQEAPTSQRRGYNELRPGDLVFFRTGWMDGTWRGIDHGGVALGNGWMVHSSGSRSGVVINHIGEGWWRDAYVMGRDLIG